MSLKRCSWQVLHAQSDLDGALQHFRRALAMREEALSSKHPLVARSLLGIGAVSVVK